MKILFVADGRSPIALNWMAYFVELGYEVHLVTLFACEPDLKFASIHVVPAAFSNLKSSKSGKPDQKRIRESRSRVRAAFRTSLRHWIGPLTLPSAGKRLGDLVDDLNPDLVHAMRIPYEGMLAAQALRKRLDTPLVISVWGNDFTLHAHSTFWMSSYTRKTLIRANGLHVDCKRDQRLATQWGYAREKPSIILPGNGGIRMDDFFPPVTEDGLGVESIINPRGIRAYVRNDTFFRAARRVLDERPAVKFLCPAMAGEVEAENWVRKLGLGNSVALLPKVSNKEMGELFRKSVITVSPSIHDGTPNTLLEGMACGCFPIAGDIESLREWITPEENGLLIDPSDPAALAAAILFALDQPEFRHMAEEINLRLVNERAEYSRIMHKARQFYDAIIH